MRNSKRKEALIEAATVVSDFLNTLITPKTKYESALVEGATKACIAIHQKLLDKAMTPESRKYQ